MQRTLAQIHKARQRLNSSAIYQAGFGAAIITTQVAAHSEILSDKMGLATTAVVATASGLERFLAFSEVDKDRPLYKRLGGAALAAASQGFVAAGTFLGLETAGEPAPVGNTGPLFAAIFIIEGLMLNVSPELSYRHRLDEDVPYARTQSAIEPGLQEA